MHSGSWWSALALLSSEAGHGELAPAGIALTEAGHTAFAPADVHPGPVHGCPAPPGSDAALVTPAAEKGCSHACMGMGVVLTRLHGMASMQQGEGSCLGC